MAQCIIRKIKLRFLNKKSVKGIQKANLFYIYIFYFNIIFTYFLPDLQLFSHGFVCIHVQMKQFILLMDIG